MNKWRNKAGAVWLFYHLRKAVVGCELFSFNSFKLHYEYELNCILDTLHCLYLNGENLKNDTQIHGVPLDS